MVRIFDRDEALENVGRLCEYIEYHRLIGVEHFYLFDAAEADSEWLGKWPAVQAYMKAGLVSYRLLHGGPNYMPWSGRLQEEVYRHAIHNARQRSVWVLLCDMDEYVYLPRDATLGGMLQRLEAGSLDRQGTPKTTAYRFLNWFVSGLMLRPRDDTLLVMEQYLWRQLAPVSSHRPDADQEVERTKMLVHCASWRSFLRTIHTPIVTGGSVVLDTSDGYFLHFWKQRSPPDALFRQIEHFPLLSERFATQVRAGLDALAIGADIPRSQLNGGPFPHVPSQWRFEQESLLAKQRSERNNDPRSNEREEDGGVSAEDAESMDRKGRLGELLQRLAQAKNSNEFSRRKRN